MNHTGAMSGAGQETRPLWRIQECPQGRHSNPALRLCCTVSPCTSCLSPGAANMHSAATVQAHISRVQEVPYSTHTFLILPLDAASGLVTMAGTKRQWGEDVFWRGGAYCTSFP